MTHLFSPRRGYALTDDDIFPGDRIEPDPEVPPDFGEAAPDRDPKEHPWDQDNHGLNKVMWDAAGHNNLAVVAQV